jgi:hypothetical protein
MRKAQRLQVVLITTALILRLAAPIQLISAADRSPINKSQLDRTSVLTKASEAGPLTAQLSHEANEKNSTSLLSLLPTSSLPDCGGEGEKPCGATTEFFWDNGNLFCDRGLQAKGFKVIGGTIYFNANDWLNLNRVNLTKLIKLIQVDLPALEKRVNNLDKDDFLSKQCAGDRVDGKCYTVPPICGPLGCTGGIEGVEIPLPDFDKSGWDIVKDVANFIDTAFSALNSANLPAAIKGIPGGKPSIDFSFSKKDFDFSSFESSLNTIKNFFTNNPFIKKLKDLVNDFVNPPGQCVNRTRHQQAADDFQKSWTYWALLNQRNLSRYEPLNWTQYIDTHNAFNNAADGYPGPNQIYALTDQLNMGARSLSLDIHWFNARVRLCHGQAAHQGCSNVDRYYSNGIKEIGNWLRAHPDEVISIVFEDRSDGHDEDVNAPLAAYLGDLIYKPADGIKQGFLPSKKKKDADGNEVKDANGNVILIPDWDAIDGMFWPAIKDIRDTGKQILIFSDEPHGDEYIWKRSDNQFGFQRAKTFVYTNESYKPAEGLPPAYAGGSYRCLSYKAGDPEEIKLDQFFDFTRFKPYTVVVDSKDKLVAPDNKGGFFTVMYESRSLLDVLDITGLLDESEVAQLANCQVTEISLDYLQSKEHTSPAICSTDTSPGTCVTPDTRLTSTVWSWRENDRGDSGDAALFNANDGRWSSKDPSEFHHFACAQAREGNPSAWKDQVGETWKITEGVGTWYDGDRQCRTEFGPDYVLSTPVIGWQNMKLKSADTKGYDLWLNYNDIRTEGRWAINRKPHVDAGADQTSNEGQTVFFNGSGSSDPDGDTLSYSWSFGDGLSGAGATPTHVYPDNGSYTATLTVTDEFGGVESKNLTVTVNNVTPTLNIGANQAINENGVIAIPSASFTDPGFDCPTCLPGTIEGFSASIDWGEGTMEEGGISKTQGTPGVLTSGMITGKHLYGDNGTYTVKVCIADDDGAKVCRTLNVTVGNVAPTVRLNKSTAINFGSGEAFLGRRGEKPAFSAESSDVGTDDLTFIWSFPPSALGSMTTYFNNGLTVDPPRSPNGLFPFTVSHPNQTIFDNPGVYTAAIRVLDDDGGDATTSLPLLITDNLGCIKDWKQQFGQKGSPLIDSNRLAAYLSLVRFASPYFDNNNLATPAQAEEILSSQGGNPFLREVRKEALEAWLNFASGGVKWNAPIRSLNKTFSQVMAEVDAIMLNPNASKDDYKRASAAARNINQMSCSKE